MAEFEGPLPTRRSIQVHEVLDCQHHPREHHNTLQRPMAVTAPCAGAEGSPEGNEDAGGWLRWSLARAIAVGSDRSSRNCREKFPSGRLRDLERLPSCAPFAYASPCRLHGTSPYLFDTRGGSTGGASGAADGEFSGFTLFRPGGRQNRRPRCLPGWRVIRRRSLGRRCLDTGARRPLGLRLEVMFLLFVCPGGGLRQCAKGGQGLRRSLRYRTPWTGQVDDVPRGGRPSGEP